MPAAELDVTLLTGKEQNSWNIKTKTMKAKSEMVPGVKYRGYGILNEYREFQFIPEETGSRKGQIKVVKEGDGFKVSTTKNTVQVLVSLPKLKGLELVKAYLEKMNQVLTVINSYDF